MSKTTLIQELLESDGSSGPMIIDGGLATQLETVYDQDLNDALWSTKILNESPEIVQKAHEDFIRAGANLLITCTYQTFMDTTGTGRGFATHEEFEKSLGVAVRCARQAVSNAAQAEQKVFVVGSLGAYGASLCNGEEYSGEYQMEKKSVTEQKEFLKEWHLPRFNILGGLVDLVALETCPYASEGIMMSDLLAEKEVYGYISFACKSGRELGSGEAIEETIAQLKLSPYLVGVGVNCTSLRYISELVERIRKSLDRRGESGHKVKIFVYPNSGEVYDGVKKSWHIDPELKGETLCTLASEWSVHAIGGCCRVYSHHILDLKKFLKGKKNQTKKAESP